MVEFDKGSIKSQNDDDDPRCHDVQDDDDCDKFNAPRSKQVKFEGNEVSSIDHMKNGEKNSKSPRLLDNGIDSYFGYREALKSDITSVTNNTLITSNSLSLPFLANITHDGFQFEQFEGCSSLTKQYNSATSVLQNFSTSRPFMETTTMETNKYIGNNNTNNILFTKYFPDFPTSLIPNKNAVSTSNYSFAAPPILQSNFSSIPNLISSKPSSAFQQFSPSYFPLIMSSGFTTLGTNSYSSSMNAQNCFNSKLGVADTLNNNFMYTSNFFSGLSANKLASYPFTQGSTHIYPPFINSNIFSSNTIPNVLGNALNQVIPNSAYSNDTMMAGENNTMQSVEATEVTDASFSPTMPCVNNVHSQHEYESRIQFESSSYNGIYCDLNQPTPVYSEKPLRKKNKQHLNAKKILKSKKNLTNELNHNIERVFIWDLDDVIIALHSLVTGEYSTRFGKDSSSTASLGLRVEEYIYDLCVTFLFYNDLEEYDQSHIDDASVDDNGQDISDYSFETDGFNNSTSNNILQFPSNGRRGLDWMRKLAYRYRRIREIYDSYRNNIEEIINLNKRDQWVPLLIELEQITDSWHTLAYKSLNIIYRRSNCVNVLVTKTHLVQSISKCLLFKLANFFPIENVYSANKAGKEACFQRIQARFGTKCTYVVIGNGRDEETACKQLGFPFWRISNHSDLINLQHALELSHL